jgi:hypothetical protein
MDFPFWGARNDHFRSWATIYFQSSASALRDTYISHRQTTAYHHESNGTVERLYRRRNMVRGSTLCAPRTLCTAEGRHWSLAEAVFGAPIMLLNEFCQNEELSVDSVIKSFSKTLHVPATSLPMHNSSTQLPCELPAELLFAPPHLGPSGRRHSTPSAAQRWPLRRSAPWPPLLHHPSRVTRRGHRRQPP